MKKLFKIFVNDFNVREQAKELGIPVWQTPSVLFLLMGIIIITVMTGVYFIFQRYNSPEILILSEVAIVLILFTIGNFIIQGVEQMAKVNKMKSEFVSIASHQLKTPLAEISWEIELLLSKNSEGLNEKQKDLINRIEKSSVKMTRLANDLLDVARIEQGELPLAKEKVDVLKLIDQIVQNNKIIAQANNVQIKIKKPKNLPKAFIDKRRIGVALDNLISNAIKYIRKKGLVRVSVNQSGKNIIFSVEDNGVGIPWKQHGNVFEKFFRSSNVFQHQVSGTGLGLYIAKNIVEQSGGRIWFDSVPEEGSTFYFSLPLKNN